MSRIWTRFGNTHVFQVQRVNQSAMLAVSMGRGFLIYIFNSRPLSPYFRQPRHLECIVFFHFLMKLGQHCTGKDMKMARSGKAQRRNRIFSNNNRKQRHKDELYESKKQ